MPNTANIVTHSLALLAGLSAGVLAYTLINSKKKEDNSEYTIADQPLRFARDKAANNVRVMNIDAVYNPTYARGKTVLVTGELLSLPNFVPNCLFCKSNVRR